jgi:hypothetical protein
MSTEVVDITVDALKGLENSIPAVHHVIVHRNGHQKRVCDHAPQNTAIHGEIVLMIGLDQSLCQTLTVLQTQMG